MDLTGSGTDFDKVRGSEIQCASEWALAPTRKSAGRLAVAFTNGNVFATLGGWLISVEQHQSTPGSYSSSDDSKGSYAKIISLTAVGGGGELDNATVAIDIELDRELSGLPILGDNVFVAMPESVFQNVTAAEAKTGIVDYSGLYFGKLESGVAGDTEDHDDVEVWVEPVMSGGCKIEIMRPEPATLALTQFSGTFDNEIATRFVTPFSALGSALEENSFYNDAGPAGEFTSQALGAQNGELKRTALSPVNQYGPIWLKRTVPADAQPSECVFIIRLTSVNGHNTSTPETPVSLADFDKLNSGSILSWTIAEPVARVVTISIDRTIHPGGGVRLTARIVDDTGSPLPGRWLNITADAGTITRTARTFSDSAGEVTVIFELPFASPPATVTFSATFVDPV